MSRDFLFREESRMASEFLKSSEDGPSKERAGFDVKRVLIFDTGCVISPRPLLQVNPGLSMFF